VLALEEARGAVAIVALALLVDFLDEIFVDWVTGNSLSRC
jgi:hypothetical protein